VTPIRIIIAGGRDFDDDVQLRTEMRTLTREWKDTTKKRVEVVCGMCRGADLLGKAWADDRRIPVKEMPADWDKHPRAGGHLRNREMAIYASEFPYGILVAFWDFESTGTKGMIDMALGFGMEVHVYRYEA
jgi:hypothetical protein